MMKKTYTFVIKALPGKEELVRSFLNEFDEKTDLRETSQGVFELDLVLNSKNVDSTLEYLQFEINGVEDADYK